MKIIPHLFLLVAIALFAACGKEDIGGNNNNNSNNNTNNNNNNNSSTNNNTTNNNNNNNSLVLSEFQGDHIVNVNYHVSRPSFGINYDTTYVDTITLINNDPEIIFKYGHVYKSLPFDHHDTLKDTYVFLLNISVEGFYRVSLDNYTDSIFVLYAPHVGQSASISYTMKGKK